jgi:hypothetical protein
LKKTRRRFALQASEQALYQELVDICNDENWRTSFQVSNGELTTALNCNEKSLIKWRQSLVNAGLIKYSSGQSKRSFGLYSLVVQTTVKNTANEGANKGTNQTANKGTNGSDYYKLKETEPTQTSKSHSGEKSPEKKKSDLIFWKQFVTVWNEWYKTKFNESYGYMEKDFAHLKKIYKFLEKRAADKKFEFTEENLLAAFKFFLNKAWDKDTWLRQNFSIPNILSQFNQIANGESIAKNRKQATGANVSTGSILSKIAAMPD